jgi:hypothetical protein
MIYQTAGGTPSCTEALAIFTDCLSAATAGLTADHPKLSLGSEICSTATVDLIWTLPLSLEMLYCLALASTSV